MRTGRISFSGLLAAGLLLPQQPDPGRLYGRVESVSGQVHVGYIRWFQGEGSWTDVLPASKALPKENFDQVQRLRAAADPEADRAARTIEYNGVRISWEVDDLEALPVRSESGVRFAHVASVARVGEGDMRLSLRSGEDVEISTPVIEDDDRQLVIEVGGGAQVVLAWTEVRSVELQTAPVGATPVATRMHGTLEDRSGTRYTGNVSWGGAALYATELLVEPQGTRSSGIPFEQVSTLERTGRSQARVTLGSGEVIDVGGGAEIRFATRSVRVLDVQLGQVQVPWNEVVTLRFHPPAESYGTFAAGGSRRLRGVVVTQTGERHAGWIRWDNDEEYGWEMLNGRAGNRIFVIELAQVREIRRRTTRSADVTLFDGRTFQLDGSNDVGMGNKGIVVEKDDGSSHFVDWTAFRDLTLDPFDSQRVPPP